MGYVIRMPQMGMTMDEGTVLEWHVGEGTEVGPGDPIAEIESEKTVTDVEAREAGTVERVLVGEGTTVGPGDPIGILTGAGENAEDFEDEYEAPTETSTGSTEPAPPDGAAGGRPTTSDDSERRATPGARRLARKEGIELAGVEGTGPQGVVTEDDVDAAAGGFAPETDLTVADSEPLSGTQRTIADRLQRSSQEGVHVTLRRTIDAWTLDRAAGRAEERGLPVGITDIVIKAVGRALEAHPRFNAHFDDGELRRMAEINVAVAVDMERGLITPVIPNVTDRKLESVGEKRRDLTEGVRNDDFTSEQVRGGTFTVSNLGMFGVDSFDPVVDPPQVAILGLGRVREDGSMTLSLTFDHRVVNGAGAARFLDEIAAGLTDATVIRAWFESDLELADGRAEETRSVSVRSPEGLAGTYAVGGIAVPFDEPTDMGGTGQAPTPVEHLLGALGSCLTLSVRAMATREDIAVGEIDCQVDGRPTTGQLEDVTIGMTLESDESDDDLDRVLTKAERACYVERALGDDIGVELGWTRR